MIGHDHEFVQQIGRAAVMIKSVDHEARPTLIAEESASSPSGGRDHVSVRVAGCVLSFGLHLCSPAVPQRLKPVHFRSFTARLEAVPFQSSSRQVI